MTKIEFTPRTDDRPGFEEALLRLERVVQDLEEGELSLDEALARYESGIKLLRQCHGLLEQAQRRIELLTGEDAAGNPITVPLDEAPETLEDKAEARSRRRSKPRPSQSPAPPDAVDERGGLF